MVFGYVVDRKRGFALVVTLVGDVRDEEGKMGKMQNNQWNDRLARSEGYYLILMLFVILFVILERCLLVGWLVGNGWEMVNWREAGK